MDTLANRPLCPLNSTAECCRFLVAGRCCHAGFENGCPQQATRLSLSLVPRTGDRRPANTPANR